MKQFLVIAALICLAASQAVNSCPTDGRLIKCSTEEKPVCGVKSLTNGKQIKESFVNHCVACAIGKVEYSVEGRCEEFPSKAKFCSPSESKNQICTREYNPQCGYFNQSIKCLVAPCAIQGSNRCVACSIDNVLYTIPHECPKF